MPTDLGTALTAAVAFTVLLGLAVRYVLMPYLATHLFAPVEQLGEQVSDQATSDQMDKLDRRVHRLSTDVRAIVRVVDEHLKFSDRWVHLVERELEQLRREQETGGTNDDQQDDPST